MIGRNLRALLFAAVLGLGGGASADNMIMDRIALDAEIVLAYAQSAIEEHGYSIAHMQTCDQGLGDFGYETDFYRVLFFGKVDEVRAISANHPELVPYLPLKLAVIAERDETLLTILDPEALAPYFDTEPVRIQLGRWKNDIVSILDNIRSGIAARATEVAAPAAD